MYISKTPYRISFFGGGTDYRPWFSENGGSFISMSIDKYCYIYARHLPPFFDYQNRIVWSKIEQVNSLNEIQHPAIKAGLKLERVNCVELHHMGDLPARSGLGSSSSFSVGLLHVLRRMKDIYPTPEALAYGAINLERNIMLEAGGIQDQIAAAYGGFNHVSIEKNGKFLVNPIILTEESRREFETSLLLVFTGIFRNSFELAGQNLNSMRQTSHQLEKIAQLTKEAASILSQRMFIKDFGQLLNETWRAKKSINKNISNNVVDEIYATAIGAGAYGGKLLGAGAGGFMIFVIPKNSMKNVKDALQKLITLPVKIDKTGTQAYQQSSKFEG
jgi:D-glycero-alpha-D-manno-heptose-7-phosphate kinase